jgi:uncharacterized protein YjiS (DUF1127 family)
MQARQAITLAGRRVAAISALRLWWQRATTRRALQQLEAPQLDDIGLTERERRSECAKWFWQD